MRKMPPKINISAINKVNVADAASGCCITKKPATAYNTPDNRSMKKPPQAFTENELTI